MVIVVVGVVVVGGVAVVVGGIVVDGVAVVSRSAHSGMSQRSTRFAGSAV